MNPSNFYGENVNFSFIGSHSNPRPWQDPILVGNEPVKKALRMLGDYADMRSVVKEYSPSVASVSINVGSHKHPALFPKGSGIFLSSNLFVTSAHLLKGVDLKKEECIAEVDGRSFHLKCLVVEPESDYAVFYLEDKREIATLESLKLRYPPCPSDDYNQHLPAMNDYHAMLFCDERGDKRVSVAEPEYNDYSEFNFTCAFPGEPGASGAPIFDRDGFLVAIHSTRHREFENIRTSCPFREVMHRLKGMTYLDESRHLCLSKLDSGTREKCHRVALSNIAMINLLKLDGIPERICGSFKRNGKTYHYEELQFSSGPTDRGLKCSIDGQAKSTTDYIFDPNPHDIKAYAAKKDDKPKLYEKAAQALAKVTGDADWPEQFEFKAYNYPFTATKLK